MTTISHVMWLRLVVGNYWIRPEIYNMGPKPLRIVKLLFA